MSDHFHELMKLGLIALFGYLACALPDWSTGFIILSIIASPESYFKAGRRGGEPIIWGCLILSGWLLLDAFTRDLPAFITAQERAIDTGRWLLLLLGFVPLATWLTGKPSRITILFMAAMTGFFNGLFKTIPIRSILLFKNDLQTGSHLTAPTTGLISAVTIMGLLIFAPMALNPDIRNPLRRGFRWILWCLALYLCTFMLMASQSRAAYLLSITVIPLTLWFENRTNKQPKKRSRQLKTVLAMATLFLTLQGLAINHEAFWHRIEPDVTNLREIISTETTPPSGRSVESSLGLRWLALEKAFSLIMEKPYWGWGPISSRSLIASSGDERLMTPITHIWLAHFHNGYAEIMVRFGLIGFLIILCCLTLMARWFIQQIRQKSPPRPLLIFCLSSLTMIMAWGLGGNFTSDDVRGLIILISGTSFSLALYGKEPANSRPGTPQSC